MEIAELVDVYSVSRLTGLKPSTIYGLVQRGAIPSIKVGVHARLFRRAAVLLWLQHRQHRRSQQRRLVVGEQRCPQSDRASDGTGNDGIDSCRQ